MAAREARSPAAKPAPATHVASAVDLLFAYGTLGPIDPRNAARDGWAADAVRGRLFDLGPYPGLIDLDHVDARWVEGFVRPVTERELIERLDPYEGLHEGLYQRRAAISRGGRRVWVYVYARPIPTGGRELFRPWHERNPSTTDFGERAGSGELDR